MNLGEIIKRRRHFLKMTQADLAKKASVNRYCISKWESGDNKGIRKESLFSLEKALGLEVGTLYKIFFQN